MLWSLKPGKEWWISVNTSTFLMKILSLQIWDARICDTTVEILPWKRNLVWILVVSTFWIECIGNGLHQRDFFKFKILSKCQGPKKAGKYVKKCVWEWKNESFKISCRPSSNISVYRFYPKVSVFPNFWWTFQNSLLQDGLKKFGRKFLSGL